MIAVRYTARWYAQNFNIEGMPLKKIQRCGITSKRLGNGPAETDAAFFCVADFRNVGNIDLSKHDGLTIR